MSFALAAETLGILPMPSSQRSITAQAASERTFLGLNHSKDPFSSIMVSAQEQLKYKFPSLATRQRDVPLR